MTKRSSAAKTPAAAKPAEAKRATETTEIPAAGGAEVYDPRKAETVAAGVAEVKPDAEPDGAPQVAGDGTGEPSADGAPSAEGGDNEAALRQAQGDRETEPGETARPPVAGPTFIVRGPAKGFWRGGIRFDREPRELTPADFGVAFEGAAMELDQQMRLLAILEEPRLTVTVRGPAGEMEPHDVAEVVEAWRAAIAQAADA